MLRVLDADEQDGLVYVVNEWGVGTSLDILIADRPLSPRRAAWIVSEVADAMATAHDSDVAHGHLVPENILVDHVGSVRIIGLAVDAALRGVVPGRIEDDVVDLVGLLYSGLTGRWAGHAYSELDPAPTEGDGPLRPRQVRAGVPRVLDQLCDEVLDAHRRGTLDDGRETAHNAADIAALLQQFVGDPLEMAAAEAARGHSSPPSVNLTDPDPGNRSAWPPREDDRDDATEDDATEDDATEDETREVPVAEGAPGLGDGGEASDTEQTVAVPLAAEADDVTAGDPDPEDLADREDPGDAEDQSATGPIPAGDAEEDPSPQAEEAADAHADLQTQAGVPIFLDDTDDVNWVSKQQQRPAPPPVLEDPPERPLFAPDPPDGQPQRRPRAGPPGRMNGDSWPWGTGGGSAANGTGAVFEEPGQDDRGPVPGRRWFRLALLLGLASLALLLVVFLADLLRGGQPLGMGPAPDGSANGASANAPSPVSGLDVDTLDPQGNGQENDDGAPNAVDGNQETAWRTETYFQQLGPQGLKTGVGLVVDLGAPTAVREVDLRLTGAPTAAQLYLTEEAPSDVEDLEPVGRIRASGERGSAELDGKRSGRYLVIWLTTLPPVDGGFRAEIREVVVRA